MTTQNTSAVKFLINSNFKVMRKGEFVQASDSAGEMIYITGEDSGQDFTMGQMQEIAKANKLKVSGKDKTKLKTNLDEALLAMENVTEQNEKTQSQKVVEIVQAGRDAGHDDEAIMIEILQSGVNFRAAAKLFKQAEESLGLRVNNKEAKTKGADVLEDISFNPASYDDVTAAVEEIKSNIDGCTDRQAMAAIKAFAKENEIELPAKPKGAPGATGYRGKVFDFLAKNPEATSEELAAFIEKQGKDADEKMLKRFAPIQALVKKVVALHGAKED